MHGPGGYGALGGCVVLGGGDRLHGIAVSVPLLEDRTGDVGPAPDSSRSRAAVGAICGMRVQEMEDGRCHVPGEGEPSQLVVHDGDLGEAVPGVRAPVGEGRHRLHEVVPFPYDPGGAQDVVLRASCHGKVACRLGLAVDGERRERLVLRVELLRPVEDIVGRDVDEADAVLRAGACEERRALGIGLPAGDASLGGLGPVHCRPGPAVDHGSVEVPVIAGVGLGVCHVEGVYVAEVEGGKKAPLLRERPHGAPQLAPASRDERPLRRHGHDVRKHRMVQVGLGERGLGERDGPLDAEGGVRQVHEGVGALELRRPVGIDEVGVGGAVLQCLEGVADAPGDVYRARRVEDAGIGLPECGRALPEVHPCAEDRARGDGDELVPGLRMDAAGHAPLRVEGDVVLHDMQVRDPERHHLGPLPVLLEPASGIPMHGELHDPEALYPCLRDGEALLECEIGHASPPTGPAPRTCARWPPWQGATRTRACGTTLWSARGLPRSRCAPASSRARARASWGRSHTSCRGRGGRAPSRRHPRAGP